MKKILLAALVIIMGASSAMAQSRVYAKDLEGTTWKMVFDLKKEADSVFERIALNAVDGLMDEIDIRFEFQKNQKLIVDVNAFGDNEEQEESTWSVNDKGQLWLGSTDSFDADDETVFMRDGDRLIAFEMEKGRLTRKDSIQLVLVAK